MGAGEEGIFHELIFYGSKTGGGRGGTLWIKGFLLQLEGGASVFVFMNSSKDLFYGLHEWRKNCSFCFVYVWP